MKHRFVLGTIAAVILLLFAGAGALRFASRTPPTERPREAAESVPASAPVPGSPPVSGAPATATAAAPKIPATANELRDSLREWSASVATIETTALLEVDSLVQRYGGAGALARLREGLLTAPADRDARLKNIFVARLLPHIAQADPSCRAAALALSRELLESRTTDDWVRFQVLAGLGGLPSRHFSAGGIPGRPIVFHFAIEDRPELRKGPYEESFLEDLRGNPALQDSGALALAGDPSDSVRALAARIVGLSGAPAAPAALTKAIQTDEEPAVRAAALTSIASLRPPSLPDLISRALLQDDTTDVHVAALKVLPDSLPYDESVRKLLSGCLLTGKPDDALAELSGAVFEVLSRGQGQELHPELVSLLLRQGAAANLVEVYATQAVRLQMTEFLPVFQALASTLPEGSGSREPLDRATRQLMDAPRYAALAEETRQKAATIRELWGEVNRSGTTEEQKDAQIARIGALTFELWKQQAELRK